MSDETMSIAAHLSGAWYEHAFDRVGPWRIDGQVYRIADDEQYEELGEDPTATDLPLILVRESDGKFFEVDFEAMVSETSAESRHQYAEYLASFRKKAGKDG